MAEGYNPQQAQQEAFIDSNIDPNMSMGGSQMTNMLRQGGQRQGQNNPNMLGMDENFWAHYRQLRQTDPEAAEKMLRQATMDFEGRGAMAQEGIDDATKRRDAGSPEGRQAGRVYVAANPMEHIGSAMSKYAAQKERANALREQKELSKQMETAQYEYLLATAAKEQDDDNYN